MNILRTSRYFGQRSATCIYAPTGRKFRDDSPRFRGRNGGGGKNHLQLTLPPPRLPHCELSCALFVAVTRDFEERACRCQARFRNLILLFAKVAKFANRIFGTSNCGGAGPRSRSLFRDYKGGSDSFQKQAHESAPVRHCDGKRKYGGDTPVTENGGHA